MQCKQLYIGIDVRDEIAKQEAGDVSRQVLTIVVHISWDDLYRLTLEALR